MRLKEELPYANEADEMEETMSLQSRFSNGAGFPHQRKVVVVGYALTSKKTKSFMQPKLEGLARNKGILFVAIDQNKPLSDQGPFDIVLHKLSGKEWRQILEEYRLTHPEVTVLDPPDAIQHLHNRQSMLQAVADMDLSDSYGKVDVPKQLVINKDASSIPDAVAKVGLKLPLGMYVPCDGPYSLQLLQDIIEMWFLLDKKYSFLFCDRELAMYGMTRGKKLFSYNYIDLSKRCFRCTWFQINVG